MKKSISISLIIVNLLVLFLIIIPHLPTDNYCKKYIIEHKNDIKKGLYADSGSDDWFVIDKMDKGYYTDITIQKINDDKTYLIIFWGNKDSFMWKIREDKHVYINILYTEYLGKETDLDKQIINILKSK